MTYTFMKCPYCKAYYNYTTSGRYNWGSPLVKCRRCGRTFVDSSIHEVAIEGFGFTDSIRSNWWFLLLPFMIAVMGCILFSLDGLEGVMDIFMGCFISAIAIGTLMFWGVFRSYKQNKIKMKYEMDRSITRLSDPDYAYALKNAGYDVPDKYLMKPRVQRQRPWIDARNK